ncbi:MAG: hypothetical protein LBP52_07645 [Burkholderiaceae bacterium]|nr:hypothetical protein [Burkholderiaceae bacterium]
MTLSVLLTFAGAAFLYLSSGNQRLLANRPRPRLMLALGAVFMTSGILACVWAWGALVGGLVALGMWMVASVALPYLGALRSRP